MAQPPGSPTTPQTLPLPPMGGGIPGMQFLCVMSALPATFPLRLSRKNTIRVEAGRTGEAGLRLQPLSSPHRVEIMLTFCGL